MKLPFFKPRYFVELFRGADGWRWRIRAKNNQILATSESYSGRDKAEQTAQAVVAATGFAYRDLS